MDFEDLASGKTQANSEKNLQQLFNEFYEKSKSIDYKEYKNQYVNSARASVGSLSAKLEARRQKLRKKREEMMNIDHEKQGDKTKEEAIDQSKVKMEATQTPEATPE